MLNSKFLVKVDNLVKHFPIMRGILYRSSWRGACRGRGIRSKSTKCELWLVGESGCGKSDPDAPAAIVQTASGQRVVRGKDLVQEEERGPAQTRVKTDDFPGSLRRLNPRMTVGQIVTSRADLRHDRPQEMTRKRRGCKAFGVETRLTPAAPRPNFRRPAAEHRRRARPGP